MNLVKIILRIIWTFIFSNIWTPSNPSPSKYIGVPGHLNKTVDLFIHFQEPLLLFEQIAACTPLGSHDSRHYCFQVLLYIMFKYTKGLPSSHDVSLWAPSRRPWQDDTRWASTWLPPPSSVGTTTAPAVPPHTHSSSTRAARYHRFYWTLPAAVSA